MTVRKGEERYHLGVGKGDIAGHIVLTGDVDRARKVAERFESIDVEVSNREFNTYTGTLKGVDITSMSTGIGPDNTEIALVELNGIAPEGSVIVRCGSSGGVQRCAKMGHIALSTGAVRLEKTTLPYAPKGFPAMPDRDVLSTLMHCAKGRGDVHLGITATADGFYAAQGRAVHPVVDDSILREMMRLGVLNFEMETSALFILARAFGFRAGSVCGIYANRVTDEFASHEVAEETDRRCIDLVIEAIMELAEAD
jgi:uridine phosphorylase